jgi:Protein of unknown function (DUF3421)
MSFIRFNFYVIFNFDSASCYQWKPYLNANDAMINGVTIGNDLYVGNGVHSSGQAGAASLQNGVCIYPYSGLAYNLTNCVYLVDEPNQFEWIPSKNGVYELGAVRFSDNSYPVGRVKHTNGELRIGKIAGPGYNKLYYSYGNLEYSASTYEALVYKPLRIQPRELTDITDIKIHLLKVRLIFKANET